MALLMCDWAAAKCCISTSLSSISTCHLLVVFTKKGDLLQILIKGFLKTYESPPSMFSCETSKFLEEKRTLEKTASVMSRVLIAVDLFSYDIGYYHKEQFDQMLLKLI